jgi:hypothetical protein
MAYKVQTNQKIHSPTICIGSLFPINKKVSQISACNTAIVENANAYEIVFLTWLAVFKIVNAAI